MKPTIKKYSQRLSDLKVADNHPDSFERNITHAVVVGNIVWMRSVDGSPGLEGEKISDSFDDQLFNCLEKIRRALEQVGSSMNNLARNFVLLKNVKDVPRMWKGMLAYFSKFAPRLVQSPPAITLAQVEALATQGSRIEIDTLSVLSEDEPGWEMKKQPAVRGNVPRVYPDVAPGEAFFSESVTIGNLIYLSAMDGQNPDTGKIETNDFASQWTLALEKVETALDRVGSSMTNIIKTLHFQRLIENAPSKRTQDARRSYSPASDLLWKTELEYFDQHAPYLLDEFPGSTFLKVSSLGDPGTLGQNEVTAVLDRFRPGWEVKKYPTYVGRRGFPRHVGDIKKYYSNMVKVGNLLFVSGQTATDNYSGLIESAVFEDQLMVVLGNLKSSLEEAGSSLENLIKTYILLPNPENTQSMREIERGFYKKYAPRLLQSPPASTIVHPYNLASPAMLIEIEAIAFVHNP